jgi:hypothetical protein
VKSKGLPSCMRMAPMPFLAALHSKKKKKNLGEVRHCQNKSHTHSLFQGLEELIVGWNKLGVVSNKLLIISNFGVVLNKLVIISN